MTNKLYRSRKNCVIGGVCGGIGEYFDIDPIIIRLLLILFFFMDGAGLIAYLIAWIIIPKNPHGDINHNSKYEKETIDLEKNINKDAEKKQTVDEYLSSEENSRHSAKNRHVFLGLIFIILGLIFLGTTLFPWLTLVAWVTYWPVLLIIAGLVIMIRAI